MFKVPASMDSARPTPSPPPKGVVRPKSSYISRLQPSPSLPNIRSSVRPRSPRVDMTSPSTHIQEKSLSHAKYTSAAPAQNRNPQRKGYHCRRSEKAVQKAGQVLTPPLTPSSSIRTTASQDSVASVLTGLGDPNTAQKYEEEIAARDPTVTRYMLVEHLDPAKDYNSILAAIELAIASRPEALKPPLTYISRSDRVREAFEAALRDTGVAPVVFFDTRAAFSASTAISTRATPSLSSIFEESAPDDPFRFVQADEFLAALGNPQWLNMSTCDFCLSATKVSPPHLLPGHPFECLGDPGADGDPSYFREGLNISLIRTILRGHGEIRVFELGRTEVRQDKTVSLIYRVEYYDVRDSISASSTLSQTTTMFGIAITAHPTTFGSDDATGGYTVFNHRDTRPLPRAPASESVAQGHSKVESELSAAIDRLSLEQNPPQHPQCSLPSPPLFYYSASFDHRDHLPPPPHYSNSGPMFTAGPQPFIPPLEASAIPPYRPPPGWVDPSQKVDKASSSTCGTFGCKYCPSSQVPNTQTALQRPLPYSPPPPFYPPVMRPPVHILPSGPPMGFHPPLPTGMVPGSYDIPSPGPPNAPPWFPYGPNGGYYPINNPPAYLSPLDGRQVMEPAPFPPGLTPSPPGPFPQYDPNVLPHGPRLGPTEQNSQPPNPLPPPPPPPTTQKNMSPPRPTDGKNTGPLILPTSPPHPEGEGPVSTANETTLKVRSTTRSGFRCKKPRTPHPLSGTPIDIQAIRNGSDTRTTVMIRNVPNRLTDKQLLSIITEVCPRRIDFMYLRVDFDTESNVGYAFVNFIDVRDLLHFAERKLNTCWGLYSSDKVLQITYAVYQGKEALIEKFKNSCVMDVKDEWRPKIFYSNGPLTGLPEPFPGPTHQRRKERSSANRDAFHSTRSLRPGRGGKLHNVTLGLRAARNAAQQGSGPYQPGGNDGTQPGAQASPSQEPEGSQQNRSQGRQVQHLGATGHHPRYLESQRAPFSQ